MEYRPSTENWDKVVDIIQSTFRERRIHVEFSWKTVVIIPKANGESRGIRIVEIIWKAVMVVANYRIGAAVDFNDTLHSLRSVRGTWTAPLKVKLTQKLTEMRE